MIRRLVASSLALTVLVLAVLVIPLGITFADRQVEDLTAGLERDAFALAAFVEDELERSAGLDLQAVADGYEDRTGGRLVIVDHTGLARADSSPPLPGERYFRTRPEIQAALAGEVATGTRPSETLGSPLVYVAVPVASGGVVHGALRITHPRTEVDERIRANWVRLGAIAGVSLVASAGVGWFLARSVTGPLRRLEGAATELGQGDLTARAPVGEGPPEVRHLSAAFNDMASRLEELVLAQEAFVADASHQLRTPLTGLRLRLENLEATVADGDRADVQAAEREVARLSRLVDGLLTLARADRLPGPAAGTPIDLAAVLAERREAWLPLAEEHGVHLVMGGAGQGGGAQVPVRAVVDADRLAQVLDNLLANAVDASPRGATIRLLVGPEDDPAMGSCARVHVIDEGPGLSEQERQRAFDRFWRASTGGRLGGTGLGLAIVAALARRDGGRATLEGASGGGVDAVVTYPSA